MESSRWPHPRWYRRVCPVALPHTSPPIAPAPHVVGGIDIPPPLTPPPPTTCCGSAPYSLHGAGGFRRSRRSLPRGDGGFTAWHQAFASIDRPVAMGRGDLTAGSAGVAVCTTSWPQGDVGKRHVQSGPRAGAEGWAGWREPGPHLLWGGRRRGWWPHGQLQRAPCWRVRAHRAAELRRCAGGLAVALRVVAAAPYAPRM